MCYMSSIYWGYIHRQGLYIMLTAVDAAWIISACRFQNVTVSAIHDQNYFWRFQVTNHGVRLLTSKRPHFWNRYEHDLQKVVLTINVLVHQLQGRRETEILSNGGNFNPTDNYWPRLPISALRLEKLYIMISVRKFAFQQRVLLHLKRSRGNHWEIYHLCEQNMGKLGPEVI